MAESVNVRTLVIDVPLPESVVQSLRAEFPDVRFVLHDDPDRLAALAVAEVYFHWDLNLETLEAAPNLRWFQSVAAGVDQLLTAEIRARHLVITNNSGVHAINIAEHILAMMLAFARALPVFIRRQIQHQWRDAEPDDRMLGIFELHGQTLLVVGFGDIGQRLARIAPVLGMTVDAVKRTTTGETDPSVREIAPIEDLPRLLARADHVAICLPLTSETRGLFNETMIGHMKQDSFIYNIGRGPIIDTPALVKALEMKHLAGAGLDVTDPEPLPDDSPLWDMENVLITAHTAGATPHYWERAATILAANIHRLRDGETPLNLVDQDRGY